MSKKSDKKAKKAAKTENAATEFMHLENHKCVVLKGCRKFNPGTNLDIRKVGLSKYKKPYAIAVCKDGDKFIDPKWLKLVKELSDSTIAEFELADERSKSLVEITATVVSEKEKILIIRLEDTFKPRMIARSLIKTTDVEGVFEVPYWWLKSEFDEAFADNLLDD